MRINSTITTQTTHCAHQQHGSTDQLQPQQGPQLCTPTALVVVNKFPPRQRLITNDFTRSDISPCGQRQVIKNADMIKQQRSKLIFGGCAKLTERGRFLYLWDTFPASIQLIVLDVSWPRLKMIAWGGDIRLASKYLALSVHRDNRQRPHQECCLDNTCFVLSTWR